MRKYFGNFSNYESLIKEFGGLVYAYDEEGNFKESLPDPPSGMAEPNEILIAVYEYESYSGACYVLFQRNGQLFLVNGGHCSCNGLEGQWSPQKVTWEYLNDWNFGYHTYSDEATKTMKNLIAKHLKN